MLGVLSLLGVLALGRVLLLCIRRFELPMMLSIPTLLCIFTNGAIQSPSTSLLFCCSWTGPWLVWTLGFCFYCRWVRPYNDVGRGIIGRGVLANPSLSQKDYWTSFWLQAMESLHEQGHLLVVGGYFLKF